MSLRTHIALALTLGVYAICASPAAAIVNGTTAGGSSWPWAVQVLLVGSGGIEGFCGGTLVEPQKVVTSGSCFDSGTDLYVVANTKKLGDEGGDVLQVVDFQWAPEWSSFSPNDVAVLTLSDPPDPAVPIEILHPGESGDFPAPANALVAGWGATDPSPPNQSELLQQGQVTLQADSGSPGMRFSTTSTEPCFGDSGGPAIVQLGADTVSKDPSPANGTWRLVAMPIGGSGECTETAYVDLTQPAIREFIAGPSGEQPGGGDPTTPTSPPPAGPIPAPGTKLIRARVDAEKGKATFRFKGSGQLSGFQCALASAKRKMPKFRTCRSPKTYRNLAPGSYTFKVRATGPGGPDATPAKKRFTIRS